MLITNFKLIKNKFTQIIVLLFLINFASYAQIGIAKPVLGFFEACPSPGFNTFSITFSFSPAGNLNSSNVFSVELSDATGNFSNPTLLTTSTSTTSTTSVSFAMPTTISGAAYRIRVKSSSPVAISPSSDAFSGNYSVYVSPFTINNNNSTQTFCQNTNYTLSVNEGANSPLQFPQLIYIWYRNEVAIPGQTMSSLTTNQEGIYYTKINYGTCSTDNAKSNFVNLVAIASQELLISSFGSTTFCQSEGLVLSASNLTGQIDYQWYFNNNAINGATSNTYTATTSGNYYLVAQTPTCTLTSNTLALTAISPSSITTTPVDTNIELNAGEEITLEASGADSYQWLINNVIVSQTSTYITGQEGIVQLIATISSCQVTKTFTITINENPVFNTVLIPNIITQNNDGINDTWEIPDEFAFNNSVEITIFNANNQILLKQKNYQNNWPTELVPSNTTYYYSIKKDDLIINKGTISIFEK